MIMILITIAIIAVVLFLIISIYNQLIGKKNLVDEAWSGIDVQLKRRYDLIPNLVATVQGYSIHEREVFEKVTAMRAAAINAQGTQEKAEAESHLSHALKSFFAVVENYPTLRANENFSLLQHKLAAIEEDIQLSRRYYNGVVREYNTSISTFPSNLIASTMGFERYAYFELTDSKQKDRPSVSFK